jgi:hypothetical protein
MDPMAYGHHHFIDHQRALQRAEARARLSLEEQAARGLLDDQPAVRRQERSGERTRRLPVWVWPLGRLWGASS